MLRAAELAQLKTVLNCNCVKCCTQHEKHQKKRIYHMSYTPRWTASIDSLRKGLTGFERFLPSVMIAVRSCRRMRHHPHSPSLSSSLLPLPLSPSWANLKQVPYLQEARKRRDVRSEGGGTSSKKKERRPPQKLIARVDLADHFQSQRRDQLDVGLKICAPRRAAVVGASACGVWRAFAVGHALARRTCRSRAGCLTWRYPGHSLLGWR